MGKEKASKDDDDKKKNKQKKRKAAKEKKKKISSGARSCQSSGKDRPAFSKWRLPAAK